MNNWHRAFVLHSKPYSESSLLVDFFVEEQGKITAIAKGAKRKSSSLKGILQPFTALMIQYQGHGNVKTLCKAEAISLTLPLMNIELCCAFYLNELIHRILVSGIDSSILFQSYLSSLQSLAKQEEVAPVLRTFELSLLEHLGSQINFVSCSETGEQIVDTMLYQYQPEKGFVCSLMQNSMSFTGKQINAFNIRQFNDNDTLRAVKRFTRMALKPYIGSKPFKSRELLQLFNKS